MSRLKKKLEDFEKQIKHLSQKYSKVYTLNVGLDEDLEKRVEEFCKENEVKEQDTLLIIKG